MTLQTFYRCFKNLFKSLQGCWLPKAITSLRIVLSAELSRYLRMKTMQSILNNTKKLSPILLKPYLITCKAKYLFVLSHMRSRSSVLSHVLGSHSSICGYRELHITYLSRLDLVKMRTKLYVNLERDFCDKYLLDKLLHNKHFITDEILEAAKPKIIFLLREPRSTIKSIVNMGRLTGIEWYEDSIKALDYYCSRLAYLEEYARKLKGDYFFIESDDLVQNTDDTLRSLSRWLELTEPLDKKYSTFNNTGKPGYGDPSDNIQAGTIKQTKGYPDIKVSSELLARGEFAYEECKKALLQGISL